MQNANRLILHERIILQRSHRNSSAAIIWSVCLNSFRHFAINFKRKSAPENRYYLREVTLICTLNPQTFSGHQDKTKSLNTVITWYLGIFATFPVTHILMVEARRIELLSENRFIRSSTSVVYLLHSLFAAPTNRLYESVAHHATTEYVRHQQTFTAS